MCWAEKFCFFVPLNLGCILLGVFNIICGTSMAIISIVHFAINKAIIVDIFGNHVSQDIIFGVVLTVALSWMIFSLILILGIIRNKASFILMYFFFGILLVIFGNLSGLLLVLKSCQLCFELGLTTFFFAILHIYFLVAVYTVYELMQRGRDFRFLKYNHDDNQVLTDKDFV